jgi:hypothetical protein
MNPSADDAEARLHWTFEKLLIAAASCGLFIGIATFLGPQASEAGQSAAAHPSAHRHLGELRGLKYRVLIEPSSHGPLYTVCTRSGQVLHPPIPAEDVYKLFPDLDIQTMSAGPDEGTPLMMVDDHGG